MSTRNLNVDRTFAKSTSRDSFNQPNTLPEADLSAIMREKERLERTDPDNNYYLDISPDGTVKIVKIPKQVNGKL